uniref:Ubiquitin-like protease family profile domain-containing protein n=1 Tax=viral metagenome TaxID=1070528 RepID=A0A6C0H0X5_9ZZZZ
MFGNLINRSSTNELYNLANQLGLNDLIIIRKNKFNDYKNNYENIIMNLDDKNNGSHWICANTKYKIYFDSYNQPPPNIIPKNYKQANSHFEIQSLRSEMCGQLCVLFLKFLQKKNNPNDGIKEFYKLFKDVYPTEHSS